MFTSRRAITAALAALTLSLGLAASASAHPMGGFHPGGGFHGGGYYGGFHHGWWGHGRWDRGYWGPGYGYGFGYEDSGYDPCVIYGQQPGRPPVTVCE